MHRRRAEFVLDALEVIEPLDRAIEFGAFLLGELGFHLGNRVGELRAIEFLDRGGDIGEHRKAFLRHFGETADRPTDDFCQNSHAEIYPIPVRLGLKFYFQCIRDAHQIILTHLRIDRQKY